MSVPAGPDDKMRIGGILMPGRQLRATSGNPAAWISLNAVDNAGLIWDELGNNSAESGLQPFLLSGMHGETARPWDSGEAVTEPEDTTRIDSIDVARALEGWWNGRTPNDQDLAKYEDAREMIAPFGTRFPGLAPNLEEELDPELMRRALFQYTRDARVGLVPAARPADILARLGWQGACNSRTPLDLAAVLRSWEDRFGARLLEVGFADIRLLVSRPPQTLQAAYRIAAEHFAFSDEAQCGLRMIGEIARALVNNPFWDFWWD